MTSLFTVSGTVLYYHTYCFNYEKPQQMQLLTCH